MMKLPNFTRWFTIPRLLAFTTLAALAVTATIYMQNEVYAENADQNQDPLYQDYQVVLTKFVDDQGLVDYQGLKKGRAQLDAFVQALTDYSKYNYKTSLKTDQLAFWINAYNALMLQTVIDRYPFPKTTDEFPENSVRQIPGMWDKLKFELIGEQRTLDQIIYQIIRKQFGEGRVHLAAVWGAAGCAPLRKEPYIGEKIDAQLGDQSRRFLADSRNFRIDREGREVFLSSIFKWVGGDFVPQYGAVGRFTSFTRAQGAVMNFISKNLPQQDSVFVSGGGYTIKYMDFDWRLNEMPSD